MEEAKHTSSDYLRWWYTIITTYRLVIIAHHGVIVSSSSRYTSLAGDTVMRSALPSGQRIRQTMFMSSYVSYIFIIVESSSYP